MLETLATVLRKQICNKLWKTTGKSKGFGFVEIADDAAGAKAIAELNGAEYEGRTMVVKEARPRE